MNKSVQFIFIIILSASVSVFASCEKQESTITSSNKTGLSSSEPEVKEGQHLPAAQQSLDEIKWNEVNEPLIEDGMITKLKAVISSFVSNDLDQFHAALAPKVGTAHDYLFEHPVRFTDITQAIEENDRILVPVVGERLNQEEGFSPDIQYTFYFEKDKDGMWQIVSID